MKLLSEYFPLDVVEGQPNGYFSGAIEGAMIKVFLADDHRIFVDGISALCRAEDDMTLVGTASRGGDVLRLIGVEQPDVAVIDINMPGVDGIQITEQIKAQYPECAVLILTMSNELAYIKAARKAGAKGYLLKNTGKPEFLLAIRKLAEGRTHFGSEVMETLMHSNQENNSQVIDVELSEREVEVLHLICQGLTAGKIADQLHISEHTVKSHRKHLLQKTGAANSAGLVRFAAEHGLI